MPIGAKSVRLPETGWLASLIKEKSCAIGESGTNIATESREYWSWHKESCTLHTKLYLPFFKNVTGVVGEL